jgi:hypothetical protein
LRAKREENTLYMLKILNDVVNVIFILNMMEIDVHVVSIHLETKEDQLQINSHYILINDIKIIRNKI